MTGAAGRPATGEPSLTLFPAIDLKDGACVRLQRGEMAAATAHRAAALSQAPV